MNCTGISIVTGTLNRRPLLDGLIANTVDADERTELVLVDGGSTDGTIDFIHRLKHPRIQFIEVGKRSPYPHFMNLGIRSASFEYVCQWNDDALLVNTWDDVISSLDESSAFIFSWKTDRYPRFRDKGWTLLNEKNVDRNGHIVLNYGVYAKQVFRKIGLYSSAFQFFFADADMAQRTWFFGHAVKELPHIKVISLKDVKKGRPRGAEEDHQTYLRHVALYGTGKLPDNLEYLD
jgi:glycosyltransferase involved in cell wall biosynthesis